MANTPKSKSRVSQILGKPALRTIQSGRDDDLYRVVMYAALYMATAGFLDEANRLLECLWKHNWPHTGDNWLPDQSLEVLWSAAGRRPAKVPFATQSVELIEVSHRAYIAMDGYSTPISDLPWTELAGNELFRKCCLLARRTIQDARNELEALAGFEKLFFQPGCSDDLPAYNFAKGLELAAELAAKNGLTEKATGYARMWAEKYPDFWLNCKLATITSNRYLDSLLLQGIIAEPLGLTQVNCRSYLDALLITVEQRMKRGRSLVYGKWTWERLLKAISRNAIQSEPESYSKEVRKAKWLGRPGAAESDITAVEKRLGLKFPADYREFLLTSNGFSGSRSTSANLTAVQHVDYLKAVADAKFFETLKEYPGHLPEVIEECIQISDRNESGTEAVWLVPPKSAGDEWQTWFFAHWVPGEIVYPSFRHYIENELQSLQSSKA